MDNNLTLVNNELSTQADVEIRIGRARRALNHVGKAVAGVSASVLFVDGVATMADRSSRLDAIGVVAMFSTVGGAVLAAASESYNEPDR